MPWDDLGTQDPSAPYEVHPDTTPPDTPTEHVGPNEPPTVHAAGAVLWRQGAGARAEVAVVHRPRYDDWSLPKGKLDPGETIAHAAAREVTEETGFACALSRRLSTVHYHVPTRDGGSTGKRVDYFAALARTGTFRPNAEVDELRWLRLDEARRQLTYSHDASVLDAFGLRPAEAVTLLLVRHAKAGSRADFHGDDTLRPLSEAGLRQQQALRTFLPLFGPERVHSAPRVRCEQTVQPVAADLGTAITPEPVLSEDSYRNAPGATLRRLLSIAALPGTALVCSQGGVIPDLVTRLAHESDLELGEVHSTKASLWTLTFRPEPQSSNGAGSSLRLAAADYHPEPDAVG